MENMDHHPGGAHQLPYDHHDMSAMNHHGHNDHMINYDHSQQQQPQQEGQNFMPIMMMMKMYFHFGLGDVVLFEGLVMSSTWRLWLVSLALFLAGILLEAIDYSRGYLSCRCAAMAAVAAPTPLTGNGHATASSQTQLISHEQTGGHRPEQQQQPRWSCCSAGGNATALGGTAPGGAGGGGGAPGKAPKYFPVQTADSPMVRLLQASLHFVRTGLSLCLMLVAMTYNVCLIFPILLGAAVGFYIFYRPALDAKSVMCH